jgi:serine/threonine-protein kinase
MDTVPRPGKTLPEGQAVALVVATAKKPEQETQPAEQKQPTAGTASTAPQIIRTPEEEPANGRPAPAPSPLDELLKERPAAQGKPQQKPADGVSSGVQEQKPQETQETPKPRPQEEVKTARIRYQVPPLARPMSLRVEIIDDKGTRTLLDRQARSGEYVELEAEYVGEAAVTIYLGGEFVWQDRYR